MSPTGFEPVTPPLKAECSETNWATKTLSKWQGSNLRPESPKLPALPNWATPRYCWGRVRCRSPYLSVPTVFKTVSQAVVIISPYLRPICQRTFSFEVSIRFELMTPGYKAGILPTILRDRFFGYKKTRTWFEFGSYIPFIFLVNLYQLINENALICERSVL